MAISNADRQRNWRKRQKAKPQPPPVPAFDPATQIIVDRETFTETRERLGQALTRIELLTEDRDRWQADCAKAEAELRRVERELLNATKDKIVLRQKLAERR